MQPRECAKDLIRPYVESGDDIKSLARSFLRVAGGEYDAQIGGYAETPECDLDRGIWTPVKLTNYQIAVTEIEGRACLHIFDLNQIYTEIKHGEQQSLF